MTMSAKSFERVQSHHSAGAASCGSATCPGTCSWFGAYGCGRKRKKGEAVSRLCSEGAV